MDNFSMESTLGQGSYATVRLATEKNPNRKVAVKIYEKCRLSD